jgi:hypothetical protein
MSLILDGTNGLSDVDGSAATPALRGSDANTGIFFPAADTIAFAEGGVERARIDSSGNLGLGVIPSPWDTFTASFQIDGASLSGLGANNTALASNAYYQGAWKYYGTGSASLYQQVAGQHQWSVAGAGTAGNAITFTQALTLNANGALALQGAASANGVGITFPATQSASSNANTLDDYEEGTWTPTDASGAGLSLSNTSGNCFYTKVGRTVTVSFRLTYPSTASGSVAVIGGLPFLSIDSSENVSAVCFGEQNFAAGAMGLVQDNATTFLFLTTNGTSVTVHTNANVSTKDFRGSATYQAAS